MKKEFDRWCCYKKRLNDKNDKEIVFFRKREIWWCALGVNIGREQDGKNKTFERPVLILRKVNRHLILVVPLSTKIKKYQHYCTYKFEDKKYSALLLQMRIISSKRLLRKVGSLTQEEFLKISNGVNKFIL